MSRYYSGSYYSFLRASGLKAATEDRLLSARDRYAYSGRGFVGRIAFAFYPNGTLTHIRDLGLSREARILDVGSGGGRFLRALEKLGYTDLTGIDPYLPADELERPNLRLLKKTIHEVGGSFDLVMLNHSLEHMANQKAVFESVEHLLAPDGVALIRVPTVSSYAWGRYGVHWVQLDAPRHLFLHSLESLGILVTEANLGLMSLKWDSTSFQFWGSDQYERGIPLNSSRSYLKNPIKMLLAYPKLAKMEKLSARLNAEGKGDQIAILLKKKGSKPETTSGRGETNAGTS
jgi:SAM-dependent methyltransferase